MRSDICTASVMLWVMSSVVWESCCWIWSTLSPSRRRVCSSSAAKGSSIRRIFGSEASVRASDTRWRMPPESSPGKRFSKPSRPTILMKCCARSTRLSLAMPVSSSGKATLSTTLRQGKVDSSWNTMPIDLCGPSISSPPTRTVPSCCASRPPMTLNTVDLPQPDGPMIDRNSPGRTENDTPSTATTGPSAVSKRTASWSATRMGASIAGLLALVAFGAGHGRHRGGGIAGRDADVDDGNMAVVDRGDRLFQHRGQVGDGLDRAEALRALRPRHRREVDVGFGNALADPAVLDRTVAHARDSLLMQFVVEEGAIVGDHDEQRDAVMRRGPDRGDAHEEVAVAADADGHAARAFQR